MYLKNYVFKITWLATISVPTSNFFIHWWKVLQKSWQLIWDINKCAKKFKHLTLLDVWEKIHTESKNVSIDLYFITHYRTIYRVNYVFIVFNNKQLFQTFDNRSGTGSLDQRILTPFSAALNTAELSIYIQTCDCFVVFLISKVI